MNLFLIGYRGSGKTTVAAALAERLGWPWIDADQELELRAAKSIKEIFATGGEQAFRELEARVVADLSKLDRHVIALGGGAVLREDNRRTVNGRGKLIWLDASPELLYKRISGDPTTAARRPNLTSQGGIEEIRSLLAQRKPVYSSVADHTVQVEGKSPSEIADMIIAWLPSQD